MKENKMDEITIEFNQAFYPKEIVETAAKEFQEVGTCTLEEKRRNPCSEYQKLSKIQ